MNVFKKFDIIGLYVCLVLPFVLLVLTGLVPVWGHWYSLEDRYRMQTEAFTEGHLSLGNALSGIQHDNTWSGGGVHQVWGLGVPFLRLPFELLAKVFGFDPFPDQLILAFWLFCVTFWGYRVVLRGGGLSKTGNSVFSRTVALFLLLFFPILITLLSSRMEVYEEALVYTYLYGIAEALTLLWFIRKPRLKGWLILSTMAGLGAFIRPILLFYGAASVLVGALRLFLNRPHPGRDAAQKSFLIRWGLPGYSWFWGPFLFLLGGGLLFLTNLKRFDDGFEFGHRLNVQLGDQMFGSMYSTRFDCPWQDEPLVSAGKELFGMLFLPTKFNNGNWYEQNLFPGQSSTFRWRDIYLRTYDLSVLGLVLCSFTAGAAAWRRQKPNPPEESIDEPAPGSPADEMGYLALWSFLATAPLVGFYLWTPVITSRYMLDFGPAFAVAIFALYEWGYRKIKKPRWAILWGFVFLGWLLIEFILSLPSPKSVGFHTSVSRDIAVNFEHIFQREIGNEIQFNGLCWNKENGTTQAIVTVFVHDAEYLELELEPNQSLIDEMAKKGETHYPKPDPEVIRAKIGLEYLERESITRTEYGCKIRFKGPQRKVYQSGYQVAFLAMIAKEDLGCRYTPWLLKSVRWNMTDPPKTITPRETKETKETSPPHDPQPSAETKV
ncbi:MAG: hypothetical protein M0Q48_05275 [Verrucomicrobia bacterium]|nr:hypothetical protein [Verrucomicrobiota bacterium]